MAYIDVIPLADAKAYLRVDDTLTDDDTQITRMIGSALSYIELFTNVLMFDREKAYNMKDGFVRVYDYPINSITSPDESDLTVEQRGLYTNYSYNIESTLTLNVGYDDPTDIPTELIDVALEIIDLLYYANNTGKTLKDLSPLSVAMLNMNKRFLL